LPQLPGVQWVSADLRDNEVIGRCGRDCEAVLHTAAEHEGDMRGADASFIFSITNALRGSGKPFISTSASVVYGDTGMTPRTEDGQVSAPLQSRAWRLDHDAQVEKLVEQGIRSVVLRPPTIYGYGSGIVRARIAHAARNRRALYIDEGSKFFSTIHVDDLIDAYISALFNPIARGVYNVASRETLSRLRFAELVADLLSHGVTAESVTLTAALAEQGELAAIGTINQVLSTTRIEQELNWHAFRPTLEYELRFGSYAGLNFEDFNQS
jgi:nucleoside-diphosphate-sugar epimerase